MPDFIVNQDASLTLVKTRSSLIGTEIQAAHKTMVYGYYSAAHADRTVASDVDGSAIGFGVPGSTAANEQIVEATAGVTHTFFRDPKIGGVQFMAQVLARAAHALLGTLGHARRCVCEHDLFERPLFPAMTCLPRRQTDAIRMMRMPWRGHVRRRSARRRRTIDGRLESMCTIGFQLWGDVTQL